MTNLSHDAAIKALCDCAATVTVLSYQEAIEGYFSLRGLPIPSDATLHPSPEAPIEGQDVERTSDGETLEDIMPRLPSNERLAEVQQHLERLMKICDASKSCMTPEGGAVKPIVYNFMLSALDDAAFLAYAMPVVLAALRAPVERKGEG